MVVQRAHGSSADVPQPFTTDVVGDPAVWNSLSCTTESAVPWAAEVVVLRVNGEVDLCTLPILHAALDDGLDQHPAHLLVDLTLMTFCSVRGLDLLTRTRHTAAEAATGYAVVGVLPQIDRVWTLCWDDDLPVRYHSVAAAVIAIRAHQAHRLS